VLIAHRPTRAVDGRLVIDGDRTRTTVTPTPDATIETTHAGTLRNERDDDVLVRGAGITDGTEGAGASGFHPTGAGPAEAVGIRGESVIVAGHGGEIRRLGPFPGTGEGWSSDAIGGVGGNVAAIDGSLIATDAGLYRIEGDGSAEAVQLGGFEVVNDVAAAGPFVATGAGLYALDEEWRWEIQGGCRAVSAASLDRAHAAGGSVYERDGDGWSTIETGSGQVVDVATGREGYAVTEDGTVLVGPEWRSRSLGLGDVVGVAVV